jgi:hypothetical protein
LAGKLQYSEKTCPSATLSTTNPTWSDLGSNPGRRGGKPATNCLSFGTSVFWELVTVLVFRLTISQQNALWIWSNPLTVTGRFVWAILRAMVTVRHPLSHPPTVQLQLLSSLLPTILSSAYAELRSQSKITTCICE